MLSACDDLKAIKIDSKTLTLTESNFVAFKSSYADKIDFEGELYQKKL